MLHSEQEQTCTVLWTAWWVIAT